jgi:uncharacterized membrane protein YkvA (DUF1232 family)
MTTFALDAIYSWYRKLVANPKYRWWVIGGTLVYLLSPIDLAPDFLPLIGQIDDAVVITVLASELMQTLKDRNAAMKQKKTATVAKTELVTEPVTVDAVVVK